MIRYNLKYVEVTKTYLIIDIKNEEVVARFTDRENAYEYLQNVLRADDDGETVYSIQFAGENHPIKAVVNSPIELKYIHVGELNEITPETICKAYTVKGDIHVMINNEETFSIELSKLLNNEVVPAYEVEPLEDGYRVLDNLKEYLEAKQREYLENLEVRVVGEEARKINEGAKMINTKQEFLVVWEDIWHNKDSERTELGKLGDVIKEFVEDNEVVHESGEEVDYDKYNSDNPYDVGTTGLGFYDLFFNEPAEEGEQEGDYAGRIMVFVL